MIATPLIKFWNMYEYQTCWQRKNYKRTETRSLLKKQTLALPKGKGSKAWKRYERLDKRTHWITKNIGVN